ncbi:bifunctional UDP-N-acetylglucosamine diphosphorylase/glucosamine-1-phosphate N-acetyltransferase GlmU [Endozoicomonas sp.]|nr:bifunctional UDP-N-acetylglucosamine diphosphorylase/glucosamine-1-phosphate N-acetyltransferase GlmU [Endozoicomonas sp.]
MRTDIVILAAGQGSRMKSKLPKILHRIAGKSMLEHVISAACNSQSQYEKGKIHVVVGHGADKVRDQLSHHDVNWVQQNEQLGTGHAVKQALPGLTGADAVLVVYGDVPLINPSTLTLLTEACHGEHLALLTANMPDPSGYGRIVRDNMGHIQAIVEQKDATPEQLAIHEVNTGIMAIPGSCIKDWLNSLSNENAQQEYYLTDTVAMAVAEGITVVHAQPAKLTEVQGVNSRLQLSELERQYQAQQAEAFMTAGTTILDPQRIDFRGNIQIGQDVVLDVNVVLEGDVVLGDNVTIEPGCIIRNSRIASGAVIKAHSILEEAVVSSDCEVGPFARLRPGTELANNARVGNFVEIKKSQIGQGSKVNHLTYIGDAEVGTGVNIGAGTVTCNYDGANKHKTIVSDGAFIGTNSSLVAPVTIGKGATAAAGSVITRDLADEELGVARGRQRNISGWKRPVKKTN